jgi:hypothetical protein
MSVEPYAVSCGTTVEGNVGGKGSFALTAARLLPADPGVGSSWTYGTGQLTFAEVGMLPATGGTGKV